MLSPFRREIDGDERPVDEQDDGLWHLEGAREAFN